MLLQTNSYVVPKEKRDEHARLMRRFRQALTRLGCDMFAVYEQVGANWSSGETNGRFVQIMRFRDRKHQLAVQNAERSDPTAQSLIAEFCELVNFPYQQQQGLFAVGFYNSVLLPAAARSSPGRGESAHDPEAEEVEELPLDEELPPDVEGEVEEHREGQPPAQDHGRHASRHSSEEDLSAGRVEGADVELDDEPGGEEAA